MFLFGGAVGGTQQEIARATHPSTGGRPGALRPFALFAVAAVVLLGIVSSIFLAPSAFAAAPVPLSIAFVLGLIGYVLTSVVTGILYGVGRPDIVGAMISVDAALRGLAVVVGLLLQAPPTLLAFGIALPFGASVAIVWLVVRGRIARGYRVDASTGTLLMNALRTVGASAAVGVMVAGLPLLLSVLLTDASAPALAALILVITVTRAPLIIPIMALQSYLVVHFRGFAGDIRRRLLLLVGGLVVVGVLAMMAGLLLGAPVIGLISRGRYEVDEWTVAVVIGSAALIGMMCVTSAALIARSQHNAFLIGWVVAALLTIAMLAWLPGEPVVRALIALCAPPALGLGIHLAVVLRLPAVLAQETSS